MLHMAAPELGVDLDLRVAEPDEGRVATPERALADDRVEDRLDVLGQVLDQQRQPVLDALDHLCWHTLSYQNL